MVFGGIIILIILLTVLTTRGISQIIDLIHKDTEDMHVEEGYNFLNTEVNKYQIGRILFIPYTRQNPLPNYEQKYYTYSLRLAAYKQKENNKMPEQNLIDGYLPNKE